MRDSFAPSAELEEIEYRETRLREATDAYEALFPAHDVAAALKKEGT